jgi:hypothetical protein
VIHYRFGGAKFRRRGVGKITEIKGFLSRNPVIFEPVVHDVNMNFSNTVIMNGVIERMTRGGGNGSSRGT